MVNMGIKHPVCMGGDKILNGILLALHRLARIRMPDIQGNVGSASANQFFERDLPCLSTPRSDFQDKPSRSWIGRSSTSRLKLVMVVSHERSSVESWPRPMCRVMYFPPTLEIRRITRQKRSLAAWACSGSSCDPGLCDQMDSDNELQEDPGPICP